MRDHPRGCGAHCARSDEDFLGEGSSPRVRGSLDGEQDVARQLRIIPAGAGLTLGIASRFRRSQDHPRGCGAHRPSVVASQCPMGSSPRVRGSHAAHIVYDGSTGIIPAGAGLTATAWCKMMRIRDHPRGCGAHSCRATRTQSGPGSSPRVRGSRRAGGSGAEVWGIIPAGAGLTGR